MFYSGIRRGYTVKECEKIDACSLDRTWKALPDMREARCSFNPCAFNEFVYVCGWGSQLIQAFSPQTDSFLPFQLQLPEESPCCLYVHGSCLVVHSYQYISRFTEQEEQLVQHLQIRSKKPNHKQSNSQPVVDPTRSLFFLIKQRKVLAFNMETGGKV